MFIAVIRKLLTDYCEYFETFTGTKIPFPAHLVILELMADSACHIQKQW
jgi:hypothetical protein